MNFGQIFILTLQNLTVSLSISTTHIKTSEGEGAKDVKKDSHPGLCVSSGVTRLRRRVVAVVVPGRGREPGGRRDGVRGMSVAEALVKTARGWGGGHRCGCHGNGVLGGCCEEAGVLGVFGSSYCAEVHLVGTTQECTAC